MVSFGKQSNTVRRRVTRGLSPKTECYNYFDGESYTDYIAYII